MNINLNNLEFFQNYNGYKIYYSPHDEYCVYNKSNKLVKDNLLSVEEALSYIDYILDMDTMIYDDDYIDYLENTLYSDEFNKVEVQVLPKSIKMWKDISESFTGYVYVQNVTTPYDNFYNKESNKYTSGDSKDFRLTSSLTDDRTAVFSDKSSAYRNGLYRSSYIDIYQIYLEDGKYVSKEYVYTINKD